MLAVGEPLLADGEEGLASFSERGACQTPLLLLSTSIAPVLSRSAQTRCPLSRVIEADMWVYAKTPLHAPAADRQPERPSLGRLVGDDKAQAGPVLIEARPL